MIIVTNTYIIDASYNLEFFYNSLQKNFNFNKHYASETVMPTIKMFILLSPIQVRKLHGKPYAHRSLQNHTAMARATKIEDTNGRVKNKSQCESSSMLNANSSVSY